MKYDSKTTYKTFLDDYLEAIENNTLTDFIQVLEELFKKELILLNV